MVFIFQFIYIVDNIGTFSYVEPLLHLWNEADLIMLDDGSDVFLDWICQVFFFYFCISVHEHWPSSVAINIVSM